MEELKYAEGRLVRSGKNRAQRRGEARYVRRILKHTAQMTAKQRSRAERLYQLKLAVQRAAIAARKRAGNALVIPADSVKRIIVPDGKQLGDVLAAIAERKERGE